MKQGDILAILLGCCIVVLDCEVTHPAAALYVHGESQLARFAAAKAGIDKFCGFEAFGDGANCEFLPLSGECFLWLGKEAAHFLSDLGEEAASHGYAAKSAFVRPVQQELSCALLQRNRVFKRLNRTFEHLKRLRYSSDWLSRLKTLFRCNKITGCTFDPGWCQTVCVGEIR